MKYCATFASKKYIVKYKINYVLNFRLNHVVILKWLVIAGKQTDMIDYLVNEFILLCMCKVLAAVEQNVMEGHRGLLKTTTLQLLFVTKQKCVL